MILILSSICVILIVYYFGKYWRTHQRIGVRNQAPLVKGLPFVGSLLDIKLPMHSYLKDLSKTYGPVYRIKLGFREILVFNSYEILKQTFKFDGAAFSGRWSTYLVKALTHDSGIFLKDGEVWAKQRAFVQKVLRDYGRSKTSEIVQLECENCLDEIKQLTGKRVNFSHLIPIYTLNIISKFIMNKRFCREDPKIKLIENVLVESVKKLDVITIFYLIFPCFENSSIIFNIILKLKAHLKMFEKIHGSFKEEIVNHQTLLDLNSDGEDMIDRFLLEQKKVMERTGSVDTFTEWQLIRNSLEMLVAGFETTSTTLVWSLMFMSQHQGIQEKVYNEIVNVIGKEKLPSMNDRKNMDYTQAVMDEVLRMSSVTPLGSFHRAMFDSSVKEYFVPKDTLIFPNLYACHYDPEVWSNPSEFFPNHFLSADDNNSMKYCPREELIPFGIGKRQCLGESLARMEYFIFFSSILQRFKVKFAEEMIEIRYQEILRGNDGVIRSCLESNLIFEERQ